MQSSESFKIIIKSVIKEGVTDCIQFNPLIGLYKVMTILFPTIPRITKKRNKVLVHYLERKAFSLIEHYKNMKKGNYKQVEKGALWFFWWQGKESMPEVIKMCYQNRIRVAGQHPVILLTKDNVKEYVSFPDYVWEQFDSGKLRVQHLADMIRVHLIRHYGGVWLDASIYCVRDIPEYVYFQDVFSLRSIPDEQFVSECRWTTFAIGGVKGSLLFEFLDDFFIEYCKTGKPFIDYYMFDCAIMVAYKNIPQIKKEIDKLEISEQSLYWLNDLLPKNKNRYLDEVSEQRTFQKIGWRAWTGEITEISEESTYRYLVKKELLHE